MWEKGLLSTGRKVLVADIGLDMLLRRLITLLISLCTLETFLHLSRYLYRLFPSSCNTRSVDFADTFCTISDGFSFPINDADISSRIYVLLTIPSP